MKNKLFPIGIGGSLLAIIVIYSSIKDSLALLTLSNRFFLTGLPFLIIGILLWIFLQASLITFSIRCIKHLAEIKRKIRISVTLTSWTRPLFFLDDHCSHANRCFDHLCFTNNDLKGSWNE